MNAPPYYSSIWTTIVLCKQIQSRLDLFSPCVLMSIRHPHLYDLHLAWKLREIPRTTHRILSWFPIPSDDSSAAWDRPTSPASGGANLLLALVKSINTALSNPDSSVSQLHYQAFLMVTHQLTLPTNLTMLSQQTASQNESRFGCSVGRYDSMRLIVICASRHVINKPLLE